MKIKKRDSSAILNSLFGGVVPNRGIQHIMVGRADESRQIMMDLDNIKKGSSVVKFFIGPFGSGKSFIQGFIKQLAFNEKFVVTAADFTPERRLYGAEGKAIALYGELMKNLATSTQPEGNALPSMLDKWINTIQTAVMQEKGYATIEFDNRDFARDVEEEITNVVAKMDDLTGGFDFARILVLYFQGFVNDNQDLQRRCLRWLRGEYGTKTEAKADLGVRDIINDNNWYNYIKIVSQFVKQIGYSGLIVNFDEAINLFKITHPQAREKNYEIILKIYNDTLQGTLEGLYITFGGTVEFLEDERRGLFSYGALKRRLETNRFETTEYRDLSQPVIKLTPLKSEETFLLLQRLKEIHATYYEYVSSISDDDIKGYIQKEYNRPGAADHLTVGDIIRGFLHVLSILHQNPNYDRTKIFEAPSERVEKDIIFSRFSR
ncbi:ATP-binding protein [Halalkalibacter kiskunsagensis]|uniref:ATP-binding protein n=1 Tax=Halalkalibacter kiskunsagensis TaxID=1548599 RepID=A0ABV6KC20_9BACI